MKIIEIENTLGELEQFVIIENADGSITGILKSTYDAQVEHLTEIVADETPTK